MKNTILSAALLTLISAHAQADTTSTTVESNSPATQQQTPATEQQEPAQVNQQEAAVQPQTTQTLDCNYKISADTKKIDDSLVLNWAKNAAVQSFDFDHGSMKQQIKDLQACYTEQGWKGFKDALDKSGNLTAIEKQNLNVSSQADGEPTLAESKENQWKVNLPLQVVYQSDKEKLTQLLTVTLTIGRKASGDLGIMQMIAMPRQQTPATPTDSGTETSTETQTESDTQSNTNPTDVQ